MTLPQTFTKSLTKALKNGYDPMPGYKVSRYKAEVNRAGFGHVAFMLYQELPNDEKKWSQVTLSIADVLFDHGYLKGLYGEWNIVETGKVYNADGSLDGTNTVTAFSGKNWQYHVHQLSLLETNKGRINYIGSTM